MKALVLGHRGLIGSAISARLRAEGADVIGIDKANYEEHRGRASDLVVNAAGDPDKRLATRDPLASFRANVDLTLASVIDFPAGQYVYVSTVSVYNHPTDRDRNGEDAPIDPLALSHYGLYKYFGELIVRTHAESWLILRCGNVIGPGLRRNPVFDLLTRKTLFVHPNSTLPFIDSREVARAVWTLRNDANEIFNVTGTGSVRLGDLAQGLGVVLGAHHLRLPEDHIEIDTRKLGRRVDVPASAEAIRQFADEWRRDGC